MNIFCIFIKKLISMGKLIEEWKDIKGYEGLYQISNYGNVKSLGREVEMYHSRGKKNIKYKIKEKILKPGIEKHGYCIVVLCKDGKTTTKSVHRLVAEAFLENPENKPEIDHFNTIKTDNRVDNLRWVTGNENKSNELTKKHYIESMKYSSQFRRCRIT